jgi:hypothetical protein|tara:strand:+ start:320 stop:511 length:192 start_codon:yes stop_codon:yes gene_type:complete
MQFPLALYAEIDRAIEDAGIAGLCHDGRREFAIDKLIAEYSEVNSRSIIVAVDDRLREMGEYG